MDVGQINQFNFNQLDHDYISVSRNSRSLKDLIDESVDLNFISRNEISLIEFNSGFGNFLNPGISSVNFISRQIFRNRPHSEISYWQDRYENLYFDGNFHKNLFNIFNFNFGITKHSYDGKYINSDFDKWQARLNLNYFGSKKFNSFFRLNYLKIQKGLNNGLDPDRVNLQDREVVFNRSLAYVINPDAYEIRERFDADIGFIYAYNKTGNDFLKLILFTSNSFRKYHDEENRSTPNGIYLKENSHWIDYGLQVQQVSNLKINKDIIVNTQLEYQFDKDFIQTNYFSDKSSRHRFLTNLALGFKYFNISSYVKVFKSLSTNDKFTVSYGLTPSFNYKPTPSAEIKLYASSNKIIRSISYQEFALLKDSSGLKEEYIQSYQIGSKFKLKNNIFSIEYYRNELNNPLLYIYDSTLSYQFKDTTINLEGINSQLNIELLNFELGLNISYLFSERSRSQYFPEISGNVLFAYRNKFFRNKLDIKIGLTCRFWSKSKAVMYDGRYNLFSNRAFSDSNNLYLNSNSTLDFFIIGKIDKATFGITFENILNRIIYNTGFYPFDKRGGLFNIWSRFNLTWYFLN